MQAVQATGEAFNPQREHPALQNMKLFHLFYFVGLSADQNQCGSIRIRIHNNVKNIIQTIFYMHVIIPLVFKEVDVARKIWSGQWLCLV
jgi:hypothetical protein